MVWNSFSVQNENLSSYLCTLLQRCPLLPFLLGIFCVFLTKTNQLHYTSSIMACWHYLAPGHPTNLLSSTNMDLVGPEVKIRLTPSRYCFKILHACNTPFITLSKQYRVIPEFYKALPVPLYISQNCRLEWGFLGMMVLLRSPMIFCHEVKRLNKDSSLFKEY